MMSKSKVTVNKYSASTTGLLGIAFIVLKLTGVITWSWWWVTAPFWGGAALIIGLPIVVILMSALVGLTAIVFVNLFKLIRKAIRNE